MSKPKTVKYIKVHISEKIHPQHKLEGKVFGKWHVLKKGSSKKHNTYWLCRCECGHIKEVAQYNLINGKSKSCGCKQIVDCRKAEIRKLLKKGYSSRDILANVYTSFATITKERDKLKLEKGNKK